MVDDDNLLLILAERAGAEVAEALGVGEVFTTGSWYWRLARAIRDPHSAGVLTRAFSALTTEKQESVRQSLADLPDHIGLYGARELVPVMTSLRTPRRLNLLTAEALATALLLDATITVTTEAELLTESCSALGIAIRHGTV